MQNKTIIFRNQEFEIPLNKEKCKYFPQETLVSLLFDQHYTIKAEVNDKVFKSFIRYFTHQILPDIDHENYEEFAQLNQEFQIPSISDKIQSVKDTYIQGLNNIELLKKENISEKGNIEHQISQNLDDYIKLYGEELIKIPINSLYNILSKQECNFTLHNRLYELIISHNQNTNDCDIFILLQFIDGSLLSNQNQKDSIKNKKYRYNFIPNFESLDVLNYNSAQNSNDQPLPIKILRDGLTFILNHKNFTAEVKINDEFHDLFIPSSISFNSTDYIVTKIGQNILNRFNKTRNLIFADDIKIKCIDLSESDIGNLNSILIPSNVDTLIINSRFHPSEIIISPNNNHFVWEGSLLIGKSNPQNDQFDMLIYARKDITEVLIPSHIKIINSYCFCECKSLSKVEFSSDSELHSIRSYAFNHVQISNISIPKNVINIEMHSFEGCKLKTINFSEDSQLRYIGYKAFSGTPIEEITIPKHVILISEYSFYRCSSLQIVNFPYDSEIQSICKYAFQDTSLKRIDIPSSIHCIEGGFTGSIEFANQNCPNVKILNGILMGKSNLEIDYFDTLIYADRNIERVLIPSNIKYIEPFCFSKCSKLKIVEFPSNSQLCFIGNNAFSYSSIESIIIPQSVKKMDDYAFYNCKNLQNVIFSPNIELQVISGYTFYYSIIDSITIPQHVKRIDAYAFASCRNLIKIDFEDNSELEYVSKSAFSCIKLNKIQFGPNVKVHDNVYGTKNIKKFF